MKQLYLSALFILLFTACDNLEDAKVQDRNSFMHFYEGAYSLTAAAAEETDDGYIIAGTVNVTGNKRASRIIIIKTDKLGRKSWETIIDGATASGIKVTGDKFIIIGTNAIYDPNSGEISEQENNTSRLIFMDKSTGEITSDISSPVVVKNGLHVDYYANAVTIDAETNNIITLGTFHEPGKNEFSYVFEIEPDLDTVWRYEHNYIVRDYVNAKSIHSNNGRVLWATSITEKVNTFNYSYLALPVVLKQSTFLNSNYYGQNQDQQALKIRDLKPSAIGGFGAIGTYSKSDGSNADMFFIRVSSSGNFIEESIRYFDGLTWLNATASNGPSASDVSETGEAIAATKDGGFVLAGNLITDEGKGIGNGGSDVWLIKIDGFGQPIWKKLMGGHTNERVSSVIETEDGGLLICGTVKDGNESSGGLSSMFLIKTDRNGELKK